MPKTVFILGAGASREAGGPLITDFLKMIRNVRESGKARHLDDQFELVYRGLEALQPVHGKMRMAYEGNIETLLASFEMARILGRLGDMEPSDIDKLPGAMRRVISAAIEYSMLFYAEASKDDEYRLEAFFLFRKFAAIISRYREQVNQDVAILTFNYDIGLDYALASADLPPDYWLSPDQTPRGIPFLKLHGSLNWTECPKCGSIVAYDLLEFQPKYGVSSTGENDFLKVSETLPDLSHCDEQLRAEPFIVPPTWSKAQYQELLANVWSKAAEELAQARELIIIGYSMPVYDEFFQHLLALGLADPLFIDRILVLDPEPKVAARLTNMVAENLEKKIEPLSGFFGPRIDHLENILTGS